MAAYADQRGDGLHGRERPEAKQARGPRGGRRRPGRQRREGPTCRSLAPTMEALLSSTNTTFFGSGGRSRGAK